MGRLAGIPTFTRLRRSKLIAFATGKQGPESGATERTLGAGPEAGKGSESRQAESAASDRHNDFADEQETKLDVLGLTKLSASEAQTQRIEQPPARPGRMATVAMPVDNPYGAPPDIPEPRQVRRASTASTGVEVEEPTHMPHPRDIPPGLPTDVAGPPGLVPRGDSRSMRRGNQFALIYRLSTFVVTRAGDVGQRGVWRVVEYPTTAAASNAYARECSRWVDDEYTDYRG